MKTNLTSIYLDKILNLTHSLEFAVQKMYKIDIKKILFRIIETAVGMQESLTTWVVGVTNSHLPALARATTRRSA